MPPVEIETIIPRSPIPTEVVIPNLKIVEKALELPIVNDAVTAATKLHEQVAKYPTYTHVEHIVQDGIKVIAPTIAAIAPTIAGQLPEGVKTTVATAVEQLDSLAVSGLDQLTTKVPALSSPTDELLTATTEATKELYNATTEATYGMAHTITTATWDAANTALDYVAGYRFVQTGLKMVDYGLSVTEKVLHYAEPEKTGVIPLPVVPTLQTYVKPTVSKIRVLRRHLRAVRHSGRRYARICLKSKTLGGLHVTGYLLELFHVNFILGIFGMALAPAAVVADEPLATSGKRKHVDLEATDDETLAEKLSQEKMDAYESSQDPDYEPSEESEDSLEYNTDAEVSQDDVSQEEVSQEEEETAAAVVEPIVESLETVVVETPPVEETKEVETVVVETTPVEEIKEVVETTKEVVETLPVETKEVDASLESVEEMRGEECTEEMKAAETEEAEARVEEEIVEASMESIEVMRGEESVEEMTAQDVSDVAEVRAEEAIVEEVEAMVEEEVMIVEEGEDLESVDEVEEAEECSASEEQTATTEDSTDMQQVETTTEEEEITDVQESSTEEEVCTHTGEDCTHMQQVETASVEEVTTDVQNVETHSEEDLTDVQHVETEEEDCTPATHMDTEVAPCQMNDLEMSADSVESTD